MEFIFYIVAGAAAGLLSGLFGVGGGIIIVSILTFLFTRAGFPDAHIMHMALGTSLATIVFTSLSSARAHHLKSNVDWGIFRQMAPAVVAGTLLGSLVAAQLHSNWLKWIFSIFMITVALQLLLSPSRKADTTAVPARSISPLVNGIAGSLIGIVSSLVGIGGGTVTVPYLIHYHVQVRRAIGTSAALGLPIAAAGTLGFVLNGIFAKHSADIALPAFSAGFVYLPAFAGIAVASMLTAPLGTSLAQRLPISTLKRLFALLLIVVGIKMLWGLM